MASDYERKAKKARKASIGILLTLIVQMLMAEISDFWQMGNCANSCFWKQGLPWDATEINKNRIWILVLFFGLFAILLVFVEWVMLLTEMCCVKHLQSNRNYNWCLWSFGAVGFISWILQWILYLIFKWPLAGNLSFGFVSAIIASIILLIVCIVLCYANKWKHLADQKPLEKSS